MNNNKIIFDSVIFDKESKTFTILDGTAGTYSYKNISKCCIANEDANYRGKTAPFVHTVLSGVTMALVVIERSIYVGLKITMDDNNVLAIYVSKEKTRMNTDMYFNDVKEAERIKTLIDKIIKKYHTA